MPRLLLALVLVLFALLTLGSPISAQEYGAAGERAPNVTSTGIRLEPPAPLLQGATSGTIGPQPEDLGTIMSCTAGTVRVNNLANLEAMLNIIVNFSMAAGYGAAVFFVWKGFSVKGRIDGRCMIKALGWASFAWFMPHAIEWLISGARDVDLFS